jgi:cytoskeletal protein RodZ
VAAQRGCSFSSLSAKHDGQLFAVGTGSGSVQVHDVRRASQVLSLQQFSDTSSPVTTVRWQHLHVSKGSSRAASASVAPSSTVTPSASVAPTASAAVSSAATTTWQRQQQQAAAMVGQRAAAAAGNTAAGAGAGKSPGLLSEVSNTSVSVVSNGSAQPAHQQHRACPPCFVLAATVNGAHLTWLASRLYPFLTKLHCHSMNTRI